MYQFTRRGFLALGGVFAADLVSEAATTKADWRPNFILVTMDTLRKDHLGCYGYPRKTSPNLDALAMQSLVFDHFYASGNQTLPNHASIFSGQYAYHHGTTHQEPLDPKVITFVNVLAENDYATAAITSVTFLNREMIGNGFHVFDAPEQNTRSAADTVDRAIEMLRSGIATPKPFFLWIHFWEPHCPYAPPPPFDRLFCSGEAPPTAKTRYKALAEDANLLPDCPVPAHDQEYIVSQYDGEIAYMDHEIGRLLAFLEKARFFDDTVVVFSADHGESLFESEDFWLEHQFTLRPVVEIPLIIKHPRIPSGRITAKAQNIDLFPTLLQWAGIPGPEVDGRDMTPLIETPANTFRSEILLAETSGRYVEILDGRFKLRRLTRSAPKPVPYPERWRAQLALPRIAFDPAPPSFFEYGKCGGVIRFFWKPVQEIQNRVEAYYVERISELSMLNDNLVSFRAQSPFEGHFQYTKNIWNRVSATFPGYMRIVAKDRSGSVLASSEIVLIDMDSPLGQDAILYDWAVDPRERKNAAAAHPEDLDRLLRNSDAFAERTAEAIPEDIRERLLAATPAKDQAALEALGYLP